MLSMVQIIDSVLFLQVRQICEPDLTHLNGQWKKKALNRVYLAHLGVLGLLFSSTLATDLCIYFVTIVRWRSEVGRPTLEK